MNPFVRHYTQLDPAPDISDLKAAPLPYKTRCNRILYCRTLLRAAAFAICLTAFCRVLFTSDLRVTIAEGPELRASFRDSAGHDLVPGEPLLRWPEKFGQSSRKLSDGSWSVELDARGLNAIIKGPTQGRYGEQVFDIDVQNHGSAKIDGVLSPPFTTWAQDDVSIRTVSDQHMMLSSNRVAIGTLGAHKAWSAGSEFDADLASIVPASDGKHYLAAVLLADPGELEHQRNAVTVQPGQRCHYELHIDSGIGSRNDALRETYRIRGGYRVHSADYRFDHYDDPALSWARDVVATWLDWAWDKANLDPRSGTYHLLDSLSKANQRFGGYDAFILWPFWPRAGFDDRSQFDHYRDMPGGLRGLREQIQNMHNIGVHTFISYCHWSESDRDKSAASMTRSYEEFARLACELNADGALMDLMSKTPDEILTRASACGRKLVPYNEGDPTWSDTQTNLIGRIHNDVAMPEFNLKKYMLPHHPQLRVCEPGNTGKRMRNDFVLSFFNGHGVEINTMFPGNNPATEVDWPILSRALDLLRTNRANFRSPDWQPLIPSIDPAVWINSWPGKDATLYTLCGTSVGGHHGPLLRIPHTADLHYVDLWRYRRLTPVMRGEDDVLSYDVDGFIPGLGSPTGSADYSPGCIGAFRRQIDVSLNFEMLHVDVTRPQPGDMVEVRLGTVDPSTEPVRFAASKALDIDLFEQFRKHTNETVIVRLVDRTKQVRDVVIIPEEAVRFFRIDKPKSTPPPTAGEKPEGMVRIPGGRFRYALTNEAPPAKFPYAAPPFQPTYAYMPGNSNFAREVNLRPFWMDVFPVTNAQFARFVQETSFHPQNDSNFLRHFVNGRVPPGLEDYPVVYVSYDDAKAYAAWAGKRLPTEEEWQFAAGGADGRAWPWGKAWDATRVNAGAKLESVNAHPLDSSPFGVRDLVGNVWQWTASLMDNGQHLTVMLRGGSWYRPPQGRWWVPGGLRRISENYPLPLDGPAMNRLATVGFRCVKDE